MDTIDVLAALGRWSPERPREFGCLEFLYTNARAGGFSQLPGFVAA